MKRCKETNEQRTEKVCKNQTNTGIWRLKRLKCAVGQKNVGMFKYWILVWAILYLAYNKPWKLKVSCFSGEFLGDIAIPVQEQPLPKTKAKVSDFQEEIEKYKQELLEGLQIEEEGLTDYFRKKTKQNPPVNNTQKYNDPTGDVNVNTKLHKNGQTLRRASHVNSNKSVQKTETTSSAGSTYTTLSPHNTKSRKVVATTIKIPSTRRKRHESRRKHKSKWVFTKIYGRCFYSQ